MVACKISIASHLYLGCTSAVSRLCLGCTSSSLSAVSRLYLGYISTISISANLSLSLISAITSLGCTSAISRQVSHRAFPRDASPRHGGRQPPPDRSVAASEAVPCSLAPQIAGALQRVSLRRVWQKVVEENAFRVVSCRAASRFGYNAAPSLKFF